MESIVNLLIELIIKNLPNISKFLSRLYNNIKQNGGRTAFKLNHKNKHDSNHNNCTRHKDATKSTEQNMNILIYIIIIRIG